MNFNVFNNNIENNIINHANKKYNSLDARVQCERRIFRLEKSLNKQKFKLIETKEKQYNIYNNINKLLQSNLIRRKIYEYNSKEKDDIKKEINNIEKKIKELDINTKELNHESNVLKENVDKLNLQNLYMSSKIAELVDNKKFLQRSLMNLCKAKKKLILLHSMDNDKLLNDTQEVYNHLHRNIKIHI